MQLELKNIDIPLLLDALTKIREFAPIGITKKEMDQVNVLAAALTSSLVKDIVRWDQQ